jgi:hypothetical protein
LAGGAGAAVAGGAARNGGGYAVGIGTKGLRDWASAVGAWWAAISLYCYFSIQCP